MTTINKQMKEFVEQLWNVNTFLDLCSAMARFVGKDYCGIANKRGKWLPEISSGDLLHNPDLTHSPYFFTHDSYCYGYANSTINFVYVLDGIPYYLEVKIYGSSTYLGTGGRSRYRNHLESIQISKWKPANKLLANTIFLHSDEELAEIAEKYFKYAKETIDDTDLEFSINYKHIILAPQIEQLWKAGYTKLVYALRNSSNYEPFNRATKKGTKIKDIFKMPKYVYQLLKEEKDLNVWDSYRKLAKLEGINEEIIKELYYGSWNEKHIAQMSTILKRTYKGRPVFTFSSLINYIDRVDQFEAVPRDESLSLLSDYLRMCEILDIKPRIDGDSLKREHDIAARLCRYRRDDKLNEEMKKPCEKLAKYNWTDGTFIIRAVKDYEDLIDEAKQQHSCVASYAHSIVKGKSAIFFMRRAAAPSKSLITVELAPDGSRIRQKLLAYNHKIRNKSQTDFLDAWVKHCKKVNLDDLLAA